MIPVTHYLFVSVILFALSLTGILLHRKNIILLLMCIELMLLAVNTNFIAFAQSAQNTGGEIFVFFILTVAAAEVAIGLAIVVLIFRQCGTIDVDAIRRLRG